MLYFLTAGAYTGGEVIAMTLGENLQRMCRAKGLSQDEVARKLYLSRQSVSKWENCGAEPGVENLKALSRLYGVTVDELVGNTSNTDDLSPHDWFRLAVLVRFLTALYGIFFIDKGFVFYCLDVPFLFAGHRFRNPFLWGTSLLLECANLFIYLIMVVKVFWYYDNYTWIYPFQCLAVTAGIALALVLLLQKNTRLYYSGKNGSKE